MLTQRVMFRFIYDLGNFSKKLTKDQRTGKKDNLTDREDEVFKLTQNKTKKVLPTEQKMIK